MIGPARGNHRTPSRNLYAGLTPAYGSGPRGSGREVASEECLRDLDRHSIPAITAVFVIQVARRSSLHLRTAWPSKGRAPR